jgi:hypothetical protein
VYYIIFFPCTVSKSRESGITDKGKGGREGGMEGIERQGKEGRREGKKEQMDEQSGHGKEGRNKGRKEGNRGRLNTIPMFDIRMLKSEVFGFPCTAQEGLIKQ